MSGGIRELVFRILTIHVIVNKKKYSVAGMFRIIANDTVIFKNSHTILVLDVFYILL